MITKAIIQEDRDSERFYKDFLAMEFSIRPEELPNVLTTILERFTNSEVWKNESLYEVKNKNWLSSENVDKINELFREYGVNIKKNENENSMTEFKSFSIVFSLSFPDFDESGQEKREKIKRMMEFKFLPINNPDRGFSKHIYYKLGQKLIAKYKAFGPGLLVSDVKEEIKKMFFIQKNNISESDPNEAETYRMLLEKIFTQRGGILLLKSDINKMDYKELIKVLKV